MNSHVFVVMGELSLTAAKQIVSEHLAGQRPPVTVLSTFSGTWLDAPAWVRVRNIPVAVDALSEWKKPLVVARWFKDELELLPKNSKICLYAPHLFEIPANYLFHFDSRVVRRELLPDGLSNYVPRGVFSGNVRNLIGVVVRLLLRAFAARRVGLRYRPLVRGDITQFGLAAWDRTWTFQIKGLVTQAGPVTTLRFLPGDPRPGSARLVLDQGLQDIADESLSQDLFGALIEHLRQSPNLPIYYKPHPRRASRFDAFVQAGLDVRLLDTGSAEQQMVELGVCELVGFYSTPLLLVTCPQIERISVLPAEGVSGIKRTSFVRDLKKTLRDAGVTVLELGKGA
jgi:hypothetical protein